MNAVVKTVILGGAICGGAILALNAHNEQVAKLALDGEKAKLRAAYVERAGFAYSAPQADRWRDEFSSLTKWYEAELDDMYNRYPGQHDPDAVLHEMEAQEKAGKMKAEAAANKKEFYGYAKGFWDLVHSGRYNPMQSTAADGLRFDLLSIKRETYEGKSRLRLDMAVWGAPRRETVNKDPTNPKAATAKMTVDFGFKKLSLEYTSTVKGKKTLLGGGDTGGPTFFIDYPERFIPDFPPQGALAVWYLDPMPKETESVSLKIDGEVRSPNGGPIAVPLEYALTPQDEWKLRDGEKFDAEERVMPEEDMDRSAQK